MKENKVNKFLEKFNKFLDKNILEKITEVQEVTDTGLVEDSMDTKQMHTQEVEIKQETMISNESRHSFNQINTNTTYSNASASEMNNDLANLLKSTPDSSNTVQNTVQEPTMETFPVFSNKVDESTMSKDDLFNYHMDIRDNMFEGFADTCFDVINGIQSSRLLTREQKVQKIQAIEDEFFALSNDDYDSLAIFFKKRKHELHMITNNVGEYDPQAYADGVINDPRVKNYRLVDLHSDDILYKYLTNEDKNTINQLLNTCEEIHRMASRCNRRDFYLKETQRIMLSCNTIVDTMVAEEKFGDMLTDLNVEINTSGGSTLLA